MSRPASSRPRPKRDAFDAAEARRDRAAEEQVVVAALYWNIVPDRLTTELCACENTRATLAAILELKADGLDKLDPVTVCRRLRDHGTFGDGRPVDPLWYGRLGDDHGGLRPSSAAIDLAVDRLVELRRQRDAAAALADATRRLDRGEIASITDLRALFDGADAQRDEDGPTWAEPASALIERARANADRLMLITGLVVRAAITLIHGDPRGFKSWLALLTALCAAAGVPVFGRCDVPTPLRVLYVTGEDSAKRIAERLDALMAGIGLSEVPPTLFLSVQAGVWLDDPVWRQRVLAFLRREQIDLVIIDPLRQASGAVDKGPADLQPLARWLRELITRTGVSIVLVHHDAKPLVGAKDDRRLPQRASGGGIFSIADAPIHVERIGESMTTRVTPRAWKFAADPPAFDVTLDVAGSDPMTCATLTSADADESLAPGLEHAILSFLEATPNATGTAIAKGIRARKGDVLAVLPALADAGKVDCVKLANRTEWFITRESHI